MTTNENHEGAQVEVDQISPDALGIIVASEISQQISTAKAYPRDIKGFRNQAMTLATLDEHVAEECFYALPRAGRTISGPSVRLAEIVAHTWGNCRAGSRVIEEGKEFVTAQGIFHDLETNVAITYEVRRRITDKNGKRYNSDMVGMTANAACSIAFRNAVFKGVPKAFWSSIYEGARQCAIGDIDTLATKRAEAIKYLQKYGVTPDRIYAALDVKNEDGITLEHLTTLKGIVQAIKSGEYTPETAFPEPSAHEKNRSSLKTAGNGNGDKPKGDDKATAKKKPTDKGKSTQLNPEDIPK